MGQGVGEWVSLISGATDHTNYFSVFFLLYPFMYIYSLFLFYGFFLYSYVSAHPSIFLPVHLFTRLVSSYPRTSYTVSCFFFFPPLLSLSSIVKPIRAKQNSKGNTWKADYTFFLEKYTLS